MDAGFAHTQEQGVTQCMSTMDGNHVGIQPTVNESTKPKSAKRYTTDIFWRFLNFFLLMKSETLMQRNFSAFLIFHIAVRGSDA